jgi:transcriptional regulator with XRE-family HTH domain
VEGQAGLGFGGLLRQLRDDARLTQEELAEAAQVSPRAVSDLERGINRTARKDTALLLAGALGLDGEARELFVAATRGHSRHAIAIPIAISGFLATRGHWDQSAALHQSALAAARQWRRPARRGRYAQHTGRIAERYGGLSGGHRQPGPGAYALP